MNNLLPAACPAHISGMVHAHCKIFLCFDNQRISKLFVNDKCRGARTFVISPTRRNHKSFFCELCASSGVFEAGERQNILSICRLRSGGELAKFRVLSLFPTKYTSTERALFLIGLEIDLSSLVE